MSHASARIRVVIADDHEMVREGLKSMLWGDQFEVVGEASTGREASHLVTSEEPDVVLMDVRMPDMDGLEGLALIKRTHPSTAVLMVTTYENPSYLLRAIASGASGYLLKGIGQQELQQALRAVTSGESIIDRSVLRSVVKSLVSEQAADAAGPQGESLTEREIEVLGLVAQGLTNREIGEILYITEGTARSHVHNIIQKLGVSDRTQAAVWAVRRGLVH